jgi:hypothetical protein
MPMKETNKIRENRDISSSDNDRSSSIRLLGIAGAVTGGALLLLVIKLWLQVKFPSLKFDDSLSVGLMVIAVVPWLAQLVSSAKLPGGWEFVFKELQNNQQKQEKEIFIQQKQIHLLRTAVRGIVTKYEYEKLIGLRNDGPFLCKYSDDLVTELKRLRALEFINNIEGTGVTNMRNEHGNDGQVFDLKQYFYIRDEGRNYLGIRDDAEKA